MLRNVMGMAMIAAAALTLTACGTAVRTTAGVAGAAVGTGVKVGTAGVKSVGGVLIPDDEYEKCDKIRNRKKRDACFEEAVEKANAQ